MPRPSSFELSSRLLQNYEEKQPGSHHGKNTRIAPPAPISKTSFLYVLLALSCLLNLLGYFQHQHFRSKLEYEVCSTRYAGLVQDYPDTMQYATSYGVGAEPAEREQLWNAIDISEGIIAVPREWAVSHGMPPSQPFPWDATRDIYVLNGYHNLHCLKLLQAFTSDAHAGIESRIPYHHVEHCIDVLRQDVVCHADDLPLAQKPRSEGGSDKRPGDGQPRMCRDWRKLSQFAQEFNACYKRVNITRGGEDRGVKSEYERYRFCPEGSPYATVVEAFFAEHKGEI